jgi:hypothetical protein
MLPASRGEASSAVASDDNNDGDSLKRAHERLDNAITRLEASLAKRADDTDDGAVAEELAAVKAENAALKDLARTVGRRLDATMGRLRSVLEVS